MTHPFTLDVVVWRPEPKSFPARRMALAPAGSIAANGIFGIRVTPGLVGCLVVWL
ncbi:MAG: hypothetical protein ABI557_10295 [Aureliella sp.]